MDYMQKEVRDKDELIRKLQFDQQTHGDESRTLREENSLYRGRCANLQRDIEMQGGAMSKLGSDAGTLGEQIELYKNRASRLEDELARVSEERTDYIFDVKRLTTEKGKLEEELQKVRTETVRALGDSQASGATLSRLQAQLAGQKGDYDLMMIQKGELEKVIKAQKGDVIEAEKKSQDLYSQLLSTKENFQILHNEQKILSEELTEKQKDLQRSEREKLNYERELLQLRPLKAQLENFSESNRAQIEGSARTEFERDKLQRAQIDLQNDYERVRADYQEVSDQNLVLTQQNAVLVGQLRNFEKESFEIQTKVKRGLEADAESKTAGAAISSLKDTERELQRGLDQANQKMTLKNSELDRASGKIETLNSYNETLEREIADLRNKVATLNSEIHEGQSATIKQEHAKNQQEIEVFDLKKQVQVLKEDNKRQASDLAASQKELGLQREKADNLLLQVERMKSLVENLDQNKEELIKRLQGASQDKRDEASDNAILQNDIANYKRELLSKDQEIQDLKGSIAGLDASLDEMQQDLDAKTEELVACKQRLEKQVFDFGNMQHQVSVIAGKEDDFQRRLFERENEIKLLRQENQNFREQIEHQNQIIQVKATEAAELTEDIQTLTRENKFVNNEFTKATQANEFLKRQNEQLQDQERLAQQSVRALEMEK